MKKISIIIMVLAIAFLAACKKDESNKATVSSNIKAPVMSSPVTNTAIVVTATDTTQLLKVKWSSADYGVSTVLTYFVQIGTSGSNFSKSTILGTTSNV